MIKVIFCTDIEEYKEGDIFPADLIMPPRVGDKVRVNSEWESHFMRLNLPRRLEVVEVEWNGNTVFCDLDYNRIDLEIAKQSNKLRI